MHVQPQDALPKIMLARYYGAGLPRFLSPDPIGGTTADPQSLNRFAYVRNNPINAIDPTGMYGINPNPYNPGGTNPCDGMGPMCKVETTGDTPKDKAAGDQELEKAKQNSKKFKKRFDALDRRKEVYRIHFTSDAADVSLDKFVENKKGGGHMVVDLADLAERPGGGGGRHDITKTDALAKVLEESVGAARGLTHDQSHPDGMVFQNAVRGELGLAKLDSLNLNLHFDFNGHGTGAIEAVFQDGTRYLIPVLGGRVTGAALWP